MHLQSFDGKCVRIEDKWGEVFEGICCHNSAEYDMHEFGRNEESLDILNYLFYKSDIKEIVSLEDHTGPYGRFTEPFGRIEEHIVEDGLDSMEDAFDSGEPEHILRLLRCLRAHLDADGSLPDADALRDLLRRLPEAESDDRIREETDHLLEEFSGNACF